MKKVAIIRRNGLGDLLAAFPLILYFREHFPEDQITLFLDERNAPLLPYLPPLEGVVIFPKGGNKYWKLLKLAWHYRFANFDVAISAKTSPMKLMNLVLFVMGAKKRIAYVDKSWHRSFINEKREFDSEKAGMTHQALKTLWLLDPYLKTIPLSLYPRLSIPKAILDQYRENVSLPTPRLLISASTTRKESRLDPKRVVTLANQLATEGPLSVLIVSLPEDAERAREMQSHLKVSHQLYFPRNFDEFMVLLNLSDLYLVGDGGVAHMGAALGKAGVVLFGVTKPEEWAPLSDKMETFYHPDHVNHLSDEKIYQALKAKYQEVNCARVHL